MDGKGNPSLKQSIGKGVSNPYARDLLKDLSKTVYEIVARGEHQRKESRRRLLCLELLKHLESVFLFGLKGKKARTRNFWPFIQAIAASAREYYFFVSDVKFINSLYFENGDHGARGRAWLRHLLNANRFYITMKLIATQRKIIDAWYTEGKSIFNELEALQKFIRCAAPLYALSFQLVLQEEIVYSMELRNKSPTSTPRKKRSGRGSRPASPATNLRASPRHPLKSSRQCRSSSTAVVFNYERNAIVVTPPPPDRSAPRQPPSSPKEPPPPPPFPTPPSPSPPPQEKKTSKVEERPESLTLPSQANNSVQRVVANGTRYHMASSIDSAGSRDPYSPSEKDVFSIGDGHILAGVMDGFQGEMLFDEDVAKKISQSTDMQLHQAIHEVDVNQMLTTTKNRDFDDDLSAHMKRSMESDNLDNDDERTHVGSGGEELRSAIGAIDLSKLLIEERDGDDTKSPLGSPRVSTPQVVA